MAEDDDDLFPPQIERLPTEFSFRLLGSVQIDGTAWDKSSSYRRNFLAISNIYGLVFVIEKDGFMVYDCDLLLQNVKNNSISKPLVHVPLRYSAHWIDISSDNLSLVVCCSTDTELILLFFDTRNLINKAKPAKTPFAIFPLSKSPATRVSALHWNPAVENAHYLAICLSSGSFHMLSVTETVQELAQKPEDFGAFSVCWSPRGKQIMVGKRDGVLQQFTPSLEIRRTVPACREIDRRVGVCDVLWLSTLEVATSYVAIADPGEDEDNQAELFVTNLPPAKEKNKEAAWRNYEDPCYGNTTSQSAHFYKTYIDKWNMFVVASANASETALIAKDRAKNVWEIWTLDDSSRAEIPMLSEEDDPFPLGASVIYTAQDRIVVDDTRECGPMPIYVILSSEGCLAFFHMINLLNADEYPSLTLSKKELITTGERAASTNHMGQREIVTKSVSGTKLKLTSKPSVIATSTPRRNPSPVLGNILQPNMSPVVGKMKEITDQSNPIAPRSFLPPQQNVALVGSRIPVPTSVPKPNTPSLEKDSLRRKAVTDGANARVETESPRRKSVSSISKVKERMNSIPNTEDDVITASLISEISSFENDLYNFINGGSDLIQDVASLGNKNDQKDLINKTQSHDSFTKEIIDITVDQHKEIQGAEQMALETYTGLQNVITDKQKTEHKAYWEALKSRPLDLKDQRAMKEIRGLYQYVSDAIRESDSSLNDQWRKHITTNKSTSLRKTKRREQMEERVAVVKAISTQTKILHNQEVKVLLLSQMIDRLKLLNTAGYQSPYTGLLPSRRKTPGSHGDSTDLEIMANSIIETKKITRPDHDLSPATANQRSPFPSISPKKSNQLAQMLSNRRRVPVRPASGGKSKSSFIPLPQRTLLKKSSPLSTPTSPLRRASAESKSSQFSTTTEGYTETDVETDEAGVESSDTNTYSQQFRKLAAPQAKLNFQLEKTPVLPGNGSQMAKPSGFQMSPVPLSSTFTIEKPAHTPGFSLFGGKPSPPVANKPSTISYGAPANSVQARPATKFDPSVTSHAEATSNLNNPPTVVNIKELKEPTLLNVVPFSPKFNAKPDVPPGAAAVVQNILNTVIAEKQQGGKQAGLPSQPVQGQVKAVESTNAENTAFAPVVQPTVHQHTKSSSGSSVGDEANPGSSPALFGISRSSSASNNKVSPSPLTVPNTETREIRAGQSATPVFGKNAKPGLFGQAPSFSSYLDKAPAVSQGSEPFAATATPGFSFSLLNQDRSMNQPPSSLMQALSGKTQPNSDAVPKSEPATKTDQSEQIDLKRAAENITSQQFKTDTSLEVTTAVAAKEVSDTVTDTSSTTQSKNVVATITGLNQTPADGVLEQGSKPASVKSLFGKKDESKSEDGLFGSKTGAAESTEASSKPSPDAGLFKQPTQNQPSAGLFGQTTSKETSGAETTTSTSSGPFSHPGLFGTPTAKPSTGLFGQLAADKPSKPGLFGQPTSQSNAGLFGQTTSQSSGGLFGQVTSTSSSAGVFGQTPATKPSTGLFGLPSTQSSTGLFGQTPASKPVFGQSTTPSAGVFGQTPSSQPSTGLFGQATTQSSGVFGQTATQPASETTAGFGQPAKSAGLFGQAPSTQNTASPFVQTPASQSSPFQTNPGFKAPATQGGGGFMGGLGSKPAPTNVNPFASQPTQGSADNASLFGNASRPFGSPSGSQFGAASSTASSFNAFNKPVGVTSPFSSGGGFGSAPVFGGANNAFMTKGGFGQPSTFGSSAFGSSPNTSGGFGSPAVFGSPASPNVPTCTGHVFGQSQPSPFSSPGFGAAQQSGGFGDLAGNQGGGGFGGGFGSSNPNQQSQKPAFSSWR